MNLHKTYLHLLTQSLGVKQKLWITDPKEFSDFLGHKTSFRSDVSFLDLGCGIGSAIFGFKACYPESRCTGIDYDDSLIRIARKMDPETVYTSGDFTVRGIAELVGTADVVYCYQPSKSERVMTELLCTIDSNFMGVFIFKGEMEFEMDCNYLETYEDYTILDRN